MEYATLGRVGDVATGLFIGVSTHSKVSWLSLHIQAKRSLSVAPSTTKNRTKISVEIKMCQLMLISMLNFVKKSPHSF